MRYGSFHPFTDFDATKMSLASRIDHQGALFCVQVKQEMYVDSSHFCHRLFSSVLIE